MKGLGKAKDYWHVEGSKYDEKGECKVGDESVENCATRKKFICSTKSKF